MRTTVLLCLLYLMSPLVWGDGRSAQQLSEVGSRSRLLCASAMVYFNPQERAPDPRSLSAAFYHLNTLETHVLQLGQPDPLAQPLRAMKRLFSELDRLPRAQRERYPLLVRQLLEQHRLLQQAAAEYYARAGAASAAQPLNAQSQALSRLLLDYQLRLYPMSEKTDFALAPAQLQALDGAIEQGFAGLLATYAAHAELLAKIRSSYRFVHAELQQGKGRAQSGAEFYLSRAVLDLDELAMTLVEAQG
ncbi:hypothetical protein SAMN05216603_11618 [Pseudomonas benzenivorans]|nr:hypothetical protein [Pseudomonas benzenivorans]SDH89231.1 hypothetical protein SAMN05216603_11618 [Pseudomonas benzenivorans]